MSNETETPRTDVCPHCGAASRLKLNRRGKSPYHEYRCGTSTGAFESELCKERKARQKAEAEVHRLHGEVMKGARILATIVDTLEQGVSWIKVTHNQQTK